MQSKWQTNSEIFPRLDLQSLATPFSGSPSIVFNKKKIIPSMTVSQHQFLKKYVYNLVRNIEHLKHNCLIWFLWDMLGKYALKLDMIIIILFNYLIAQREVLYKPQWFLKSFAITSTIEQRSVWLTFLFHFSGSKQIYSEHNYLIYLLLLV